MNEDRARWSCTLAQRIFRARLLAGTVAYSILQLRKSRQGKSKLLVQSYINIVIGKKKKVFRPKQSMLYLMIFLSTGDRPNILPGRVTNHLQGLKRNIKTRFLD